MRNNRVRPSLLVLLDVVVFVLFRARFHPQLSEKDAAKAIGEVVETARLNFRYGFLSTLHYRFYAVH